MNKFTRWLYRWAAPQYFYGYATRLAPFLSFFSFICVVMGLVGGLYLAPADYQQGDGFRIIYVHVPSAFLSLMIYGVMAVCALTSLVWRVKLADVLMEASATLGVWFALLALVTGAIWGKPMWGTWWVWDARLTSELILWFLYLGVIGLRSALSDRRLQARACAILVLVGSVDLPIIHYSVYWWNTLHQGSTLRLVGKSEISSSMQWPLLCMILGFLFYYGAQLLVRTKTNLLRREWRSQWVRDQLEAAS